MASPERLGFDFVGGNGSHPATSTKERGLSTINEQAASFFARIGRADLKDKLTSKSPWIDFTMEVYSQEHGLLGGGGLGILKGDTGIEAQRLGLPLVIFTLFYPKRMTQILDKDFYQQDIPTDPVSPADLGYEKVLDTKARANGVNV